MVNKLGEIDGIPLYGDPYMDEDRIFKGRKEGSSTNFIMTNTKTANFIYQSYRNKLRKQKLQKLNNV